MIFGYYACGKTCTLTFVFEISWSHKFKVNEYIFVDSKMNSILLSHILHSCHYFVDAFDV